MLLRELIHEFGPERIQGRLDRTVRGLAYEAERVTPEMAFFAVRRAGRDGHDEVIEAVQRGALAVICERTGLLPRRAASIRVRDSRQALARAASAYYGHPASRLRVLGLIGPGDLAGVAWTLRELLAGTGERSGLLGSLQHVAGPHEFSPRAAGDESLDVQRMMASMARAGDTTCVLELDETARRHGWIDGLRLDTLIELIDTQGVKDGEAGSPELTCDRGAAWGAEPPTAGWDDQMEPAASRAPKALQRLRIEVQSGVRWQIRLSGTALPAAVTVRVDRFAADLEGTSCRLVGLDDTWRLRCALPGWRNLRRAAVAAVIARVLGADRSAVLRAVPRLRPVPGSLVRVPGNQPFTVLVDAARESSALAHLIQEVRQLGPRRVLLLLAAEGGTATPERERLGRVAATLADQAIITTSNPRHETPALIAEAVRRGAVAGGSSVAIELDRPRAIQALLALAGAGDVVLLTGKGHRATEEADHCLAPFDDLGHAARALETLGWRQPGRQSNRRRS